MKTILKQFNKIRKNFLLKLTNFSIYKDWKKIKAGKKIINQRKGTGYYLPLGFLGVELIGTKEEWTMQSGKIALVELISYERFDDPSDMVKESFWFQRGYKGEKLFKDMSFEEYLKLVIPK